MRMSVCSTEFSRIKVNDQIIEKLFMVISFICDLKIELVNCVLYAGVVGERS